MRLIPRKAIALANQRHDDGAPPTAEVAPIRKIRARGGVGTPALDLGTRTMGVKGSRRKQEIAALRLGFDLGMTMVDAAEMYADGGAEEVVAEAVRGRRDEVFIVTKVLPENASYEGTIKAAERSLHRLGTDRIDLYLLHWKGLHPVEQTLEAFERLVQEQKIRHYGVSNFYVADLEAAERHPLGPAIAANQVKYNLTQRGIEGDLLPWCVERQVVVMAYSPIDQGRLPVRQALSAVARRHDTTPECVALAWTLREPMVVSIPKAANLDHVRTNARAVTLELSKEDLAELDRNYPPAARRI